jgi:hypothetical protein
MRMPRTENTQHEVPTGPTRHAATREMLLENSFQAQNKRTRPRPSRNNTEPADGGLSLVLNGVPHLLAARTHAGAAYRNTHWEDARSKRPHEHPSRQSFGTARRVLDRTFGRGSHLGSTLNPGRAVLTRGVFRRSGSVACIRADASPSEVLAPAIIDAKPGAVKPINAFYTLRYAVAFLSVKCSVLTFK